MARKDQFKKVVTYSVSADGIHTEGPMDGNEADLRIIQSVLIINFNLRKRLGISLKRDTAIEMFLEFIEKIGITATCEWTCNENDWADWWDTECEGAYTISEGTPKENKMLFCPFCGGKIVEIS